MGGAKAVAVVTDQLAKTAERDAVDALLRDLRVTSTLYCRSTLTAPWGFGVQARGLAAFHVVTNGQCWLEIDGETRRLHAGDLLILPRGDAHWLRDAPESPTLWLEDLLAAHPVDGELRLRGGGGGAATELLCGAFTIHGSRRHPTFAALPAVIHVRGDGEQSPPWLAATLDLIALAVAAPGPGSAVVIERLSDVLLTQALRAALVDDLELFRDAEIAPAVRAIHERPEHAWTLGELARLTAMSRSTFAARFRALTGDSPIRYATRCRLARAAQRLRSSTATVAEIAREAGYESEFSFSRAFKRAFGVAPGAYRSHEEIAVTARSASGPS